MPFLLSSRTLIYLCIAPNSAACKHYVGFATQCTSIQAPLITIAAEKVNNC